ncbi:hypothetical protein EVJ50_03030 [Synechococcus sp. RSCCF101]|uniref:hypothetical protein n=1 Tax=Synechococcus sp. RSCCF101 TaxID=2511069 RepID=UPI001244E9AE|nr:hypothetical protein [Synechococcus sp. RSCCF101]QEY31379.1 hypothetical protein EVJ50_03030 [Synechococcus sp. RSCCF101]
MAASRQFREDPGHRSASSGTRALALIQGSLSGARVDRRSPWLAGLHRLVDGSLIGVGAAVLILAGLTLHWQHRWSRGFEALETAQLLEHRLREATATLERAYTGPTSRPPQMVATSTANLMYLPRPAEQAPEPEPGFAMAEMPDLGALAQRPVRSGY